MMPRIIGCPKDYNPDSYVAALPTRFYEALDKSKLHTAPFLYKLARLDSCCNAWYDCDADMLVNLWTEYMLIVYSSPHLNIIRPVENPDSLRQRHLHNLRFSISESDTPLTQMMESFSPVVHQMYLKSLGCPVSDIGQRFYEELENVYPYLYLETRDLVRDWRTISIFEYQLRSIPNFEY